MTENEQIQEIDDLLFGFDELGFRPTIPLPDPEATAVRWRNKLVNALKGYRKVERGKWHIREYEYFTCSLCGHDHWNGCESTKEAKERLANGEYPNFCPHCGADMRGGADNDGG